MIFSSQNPKKLFPLLQQMIYDAFNVDSNFHSFPYENTESIDKGFRRAIWDFNYNTVSSQPFIDFSTSLLLGENKKDDTSILFVKSSLGFTNILFFIPNTSQSDFISVGPFRLEEVSTTFINTLIKKNALPSNSKKLIQQYLISMPLVDENKLCEMVRHFLAYFIPEYLTTTIKIIDYSETMQNHVSNIEHINNYSLIASEQYAKYYRNLIEKIQSGNIDSISETANNYAHFTGILNPRSISVLKRNLFVLNGQISGHLYDTSVHPNYIDILANENSMKIENTHSIEQLLSIYPQVIRKYCLLVKNHANANLSHLTRNVINYINQHIDEDLSLSLLCKEHKRSASFLSHTFHQETGTTVTEYIHSTRMEAALKYLNTTPLSIREIAITIGIPDLSYFSKLFKRHIGMSPSNYRKMAVPQRKNK
ncbi:MAG: helix-turn-helix transcriptional regulator [Lachnospiraceae bacterium]